MITKIKLDAQTEHFQLKVDTKGQKRLMVIRSKKYRSFFFEVFFNLLKGFPFKRNNHVCMWKKREKEREREKEKGEKRNKRTRQHSQKSQKMKYFFFIAFLSDQNFFLFFLFFLLIFACFFFFFLLVFGSSSFCLATFVFSQKILSLHLK